MSVPRLLHIFSTFGPGGPEVRAVQIMNSLKHEFKHTIVSTDGRYSAARRIRAGVDYELLAQPGLGRANMPRFSPARLVRACVNIMIETYRLRSVIRRCSPDLVLTYNVGAIAGALAVRIDGFRPLIHFEDGFGPENPGCVRRVWLRALALKTAYRVVVPSRELSRIAVDTFGLAAELVLHIPNGVDPDTFYPMSGSETRLRLGLPKDAVVFGTVCHLRAEKSLNFLLEAFQRERFGNAWLMVVGDGPCRNSLQALAKTLLIDSKIIWLGEVECTAPYYAAMDVFVLSSIAEQMPIALLEAMCSGKPAVCTAVGDCDDMLGAGASNLLVPAGNINELGRALRRLYDDRDLREYLGMYNRERCVKEFSGESMIDQHKSLYRMAIRAVRQQHT